MLITRQLDALQPGRHNAILSCHCRAGSAGPCDGRLCIKLMRHGIEEHRLAQRRLTLDEDAYLILNGSEGCRSVYLGEGGLSVEEVRDNWAKITDPAGQQAYQAGGEQSGKFFRKMQGG